MDSSSEVDVSVEKLKLVAESIAKYNSQAAENEKLISKLQIITEQLKSLYNVQFDDGFLVQENELDSKTKISEYETEAEKLMVLSNENYKLLNNLQYQLRVRDKIMKFMNEYNQLIDLIEGYLANNTLEVYKSNKGNKELMRVIKDNIRFLEQKNRVNKNTSYKNMYAALSIKMKDILHSLERLEEL